MMNLKAYRGKWLWQVLPWHLPQGTEETIKNLSHDRWSSSQDLKPRSPAYKAGMLITQP